MAHSLMREGDGMAKHGLMTGQLQIGTKELLRRWPETGTPRLELRLALPQIPGAGRLNAWYCRLGRILCRYCEEELLPALPPETPGLRAELTWHGELVNESLLSLRCELCRVGPNRIPAARFGAVWSRQTGLPLPIGAFFPDTRRPVHRLRVLLRHEALQRAESGAYLYDPALAARAGRLYCSRDFYAARDGLHLFFPVLTLGAASEGIPDFFIPWGTHGARLPGAEM